jgi:Uncharacterized protein conserved in bacteria
MIPIEALPVQVRTFFLAQNYLNYHVLPVRIQQTSTSDLSITWDDRHVSRYTFQHLRKSCPCASCKIEREEDQSKVLLPILKTGEFQAASITPVGKYAIQIVWGDGHSSGIYPFVYLRSLCQCEQCSVSIPSNIH